MRVAILECGRLPPALAARHGGYAPMLRAVVGDPAATALDATAPGALPADPAAYDAYVISGSVAGVYEDHPWIPPLLGFLRAARGRARLLGVCFGHQAMARAFGARVEKAPQGWGLGLHRYEVTGHAPWMGAAPPPALHAVAVHQDQVLELPPGARVLAASAFTPFAALDYGDALSFQFHPEFTRPFAQELIAERWESFGPRAAAALASLQGADDNALLARWARGFLGATQVPPARPPC